MLKEALSSEKSMFISPRDDVADRVLIPAFKNSTNVDIMMGYFSSSSFQDIAPGLATFLNETNGKIRLIISPFLTQQDAVVSEMTPAMLENYVEQTIFDVKQGEKHIIDYCLACFGWMLLEKRLEIKIATISEGIFHSKVWLFSDDDYTCALSGSMNQTTRGIKKNVENLALARPWVDEERFQEVSDFKHFFNMVYDNNDPDIETFTLQTAVTKKLIEKYTTDPVQKPKSEIGRDPELISVSGKKSNVQSLKIPRHLVYHKGDFKHQGDALESWLNSDMSGILHMATGAGKTITSLLCAHAFQEKHDSVMIFITAPTSPLLIQWANEVMDFEVTATNLSSLGSWEQRFKEISNSSRKLKFGVSKAEVFIISNSLIKREEFKEAIEQVSVPTMLIADECHNFGKEFLEIAVAEKLAAKLGLSATPKRQYDDEGSRYLEEFFGPTCFSYTLDDAIGKCLTPYDYYIHQVYFDNIEMEEFVDLTKRISALSWQSDSSDSSQLDHLKRLRRKLIETASMKIPTLRTVMSKYPKDIKHTLVYCTDKDPEQLSNVNDFLSKEDYIFRQITDVETSSRHEIKRILNSFRGGHTKILTAKRVLDEGVNIPETQIALILASNTVERQWTQRRGRILRKCSALGKTHAVIHDFVVLPPAFKNNNDLELDDYDLKLLNLELTRLIEFARLARNNTSTDGAYPLINRIQKCLGED